MLKLLNLPKESKYQQFIPKKQFYTHGNFNQKERELFVKGIERMTLYAQLTRDNTNIERYKDDLRIYEEVSVFLVNLRTIDQLDKIAFMIMEVIPYPMILIAQFRHEYNFFGAHKRDHKLDDQRVILETVYQTGFMKDNSTFLEKINYLKLNKTNFHSFYNDYIQAIIHYNLEKRNIISLNNHEQLLKEIKGIEEEILSLRNKLKREQHFNKKMDLNMKIKRLEKKIKSMEG